MDEAVRRFGSAMAALDGELDWELLGGVYCEGEAAEFFDEVLRERILDVGLALVDEIAGVLPKGAGAPRRSLYLGAAVAELAPILAESLVLGREVVWVNLPGPESDELARALRAVGAREGLALPLPRTEPLSELRPGPCDHLWIVSVLTDPEAFPALHDALYERAGGPLATGRGSLEEERTRALELAERLLEHAAAECVLTTTDEELTLLGPLCARRGRALRVPGSAHVSVVVGDSVRVCTVPRQKTTDSS